MLHLKLVLSLIKYKYNCMLSTQLIYKYDITSLKTALYNYHVYHQINFQDNTSLFLDFVDQSL